MNALTIIAICLVSSSIIQGLGFYLYSAWYKQRYFRQQNSVDHSFATITGKPGFTSNAKAGGRIQQAAVAGSHKQQTHQEVATAQANNVAATTGASTRKAAAKVEVQQHRAG